MTDPKDAAQARLDALNIQPGDRYRHYKGGEYEIVTLALKEDTLEPLIVYRNRKTNTIWARPHQSWSETVEKGDQKITRFEKIIN